MRYVEPFRKIIDERTARRRRRTFGFEYELIAAEPMETADLERVRRMLPELGFALRGGYPTDCNGMYISFEPGGQIEFSSPPLLPEDIPLFDHLLERIAGTVDSIRKGTGVDYSAVDYIAGRSTAPMLLEAPRYRNLHELLGTTSDRGREMMKGTAAIHLHASLNRMDELLTMWEFMCAMSREEGYAMGRERRDIWNRTDPSRCGLTCAGAEGVDSSEGLLERLVIFALKALDLEKGVPFAGITPEPDFNAFLEHFTTIFTDVRLNMKGVTLELRTPDSRPLHLFRGCWIAYLDMIQRVMDEPV